MSQNEAGGRYGVAGCLAQAVSSVISGAPLIDRIALCDVNLEDAASVGGRDVECHLAGFQRQAMLSSRSTRSPMLTSNSRMNTSPLAHHPQLDQPVTSAYGRRQWTLAFPENPCILRPAPYNAPLCQRIRSSVG